MGQEGWGLERGGMKYNTHKRLYTQMFSPARAAAAARSAPRAARRGAHAAVATRLRRGVHAAGPAGRQGGAARPPAVFGVCGRGGCREEG